jgi:glucokinase
MGSARSALIGVDVGATTVSAGLVTAEGTVLSTVQAPTRLGTGTAADTALGLIEDLCIAAQLRSVAVEAVGIGLPGLVDVERGVVQSSAGGLVADLHEVPLAERITAATGLPAFVDNDVNALALGEWTFGLGRGAASCVVLAVGSGVGAGIVTDGRLVRGRRGFAGEIGHTSIDFDGPPCPCGGRGCLALYVGGEFIAREARRLRESAGRGAGDDAGAVTAEAVFAAAAAGDAPARGLVERAYRALGAGIGLVVNALNPEVLVVTGGVVRSLASAQATILRHTRDYALADALAGTRVHFVAGDKSQTVRGGAALVLYERGHRAARGRPRGATECM